MSPPREPLSSSLPPLIFGTATLNYQFNVDPYALHPNALVSRALESGIRAFDTSPYYGPAESILGSAFYSKEVKTSFTLQGLRRQDYMILTKAGRIANDVFDYSDSWIRHSVKRSLSRLRTNYLDVVYLHDVEFVSAREVLSAIQTLRSIRDTEGTVKYVGICGYPVHILADLAAMIKRETGEGLNIVQSYANYNVQNQRLFSATRQLKAFTEADVDVVANASPLGMGLLRGQGVPIGAMGNWHPAPDELRKRCLEAAHWVESEKDEKLETVAVRWAMESWLEIGASLGSYGIIPEEAINEVKRRKRTQAGKTSWSKLGVNVMGVSKISELEDTMTVYNSILAARSNPSDSRRHQISQLAQHIRGTIIGPEWTDQGWESPGPGFVNQRKTFGVSVAEQEDFDRDYPAKWHGRTANDIRGVVEEAARDLLAATGRVEQESESEESEEDSLRGINSDQGIAF